MTPSLRSLRIFVLLAWTCACGSALPLPPDDAGVVSDAGVADWDAGPAPTDAGTAAEAPDAGNPDPSASAGTPTLHEPPGMSPQIDTGTITTLLTSGQRAGAGSTYTMFSPVQPTATGEQRANLQAVPSSEGTGLRISYPPQVSPGGSPVRFGFSVSSVGSKQFYVRYRIRFSSNYTNNGNPGIKMFEPETPNGNNGGHQNSVLAAATDNPPETDGRLVWLQQNSVFRDIPWAGPPSYSLAASDPNGQLSGPTRGSWHTVEAVGTWESTPGAGDGVLTMYVDGIESAHAVDVRWLVPGDAVGLGYFLCDPVYGGAKASPPATTPIIHWDFDQLYVSTR